MEYKNAKNKKGRLEVLLQAINLWPRLDASKRGGKKTKCCFHHLKNKWQKELRLISNSEVKDLRVSSFEKGKHYLRTRLSMYTQLKKKQFQSMTVLLKM